MLGTIVTLGTMLYNEWLAYAIMTIWIAYGIYRHLGVMRALELEAELFKEISKQVEEMNDTMTEITQDE